MKNAVNIKKMNDISVSLDKISQNDKLLHYFASKINVPKINVPKINVPKINVPKINVPKINVPLVDTDLRHLRAIQLSRIKKMRRWSIATDYLLEHKIPEQIVINSILKNINNDFKIVISEVLNDAKKETKERFAAIFAQYIANEIKDINSKSFKCLAKSHSEK